MLSKYYFADDSWLCYCFNITQRHWSLFEENLSLCSVQSEEGVAPQGVHRAEAAAALWPSAVLLLSQHRRWILNPGFSPRTSRAGTKTEEEEEEENKLRVAAERKTLCDQNASNTWARAKAKGPSHFKDILMNF